MFGFIFFGFNPSNVNFLEYISMSNQVCEARTKIKNTENNEPVFRYFSNKVNKRSGSCNKNNNP